MEYYGRKHKSLAKAIFKEDLEGILGNDEWVCVDIRMPDDFKKGHLKGAKNITTKEGLEAILQGHKKVLLNCYSGHTVSLIGSELIREGYLEIYFLDEEITDCL